MIPNYKQHKIDHIIFASLTISMLGFFILPDFQAMARVFYVGVMVPMIFLRFNSIVFAIKNSPVLWACLGLIVFLSISSYWSVPPIRKDPIKGIFYGIYVTIFLTAVVHIYNHPLRQQYKSIFQYSFIFVGAISALINMIWFYNNHNFPNTRLTPIREDLNLIIYANSLCFSVLMALTALAPNTKQSASLRKVTFLALFLCGTAIILSQSRGPIIALYLTTLLYFFLNKQKNLLLFGVLVALLGICLVAFEVNFGHLSSVNIDQRLDIYQHIFHNITEQNRWLYGMGLFTNTNEELGNWGYAHSMVLGNFYFGGIIGSLLLAIVIAIAWYSAWQQYKAHGLHLGLLLISYGVVGHIFEGEPLLDHVNRLYLSFWLPVGWIASHSIYIKYQHSIGKTQSQTGSQ